MRLVRIVIAMIRWLRNLVPVYRVQQAAQDYSVTEEAEQLRVLGFYPAPSTAADVRKYVHRAYPGVFIVVYTGSPRAAD